MKAIISSILPIIVMILCVVYVNNTMSNADSNLKSYLGKTVIIGKDTLTITDYSIFTNTFTLANGTKISTDLAIKKLK